MARLLPYADALAAGILRAALGPAVTVETQLSDPLRRTPYVFVAVVGGREVDPQFLGVPLVEIECFAAGSKRAAADLAEAVRVALFTAWRDQVVGAQGHLASFRTVSYPREVRGAGQPAEIYRYLATYALGVRPPRP